MRCVDTRHRVNEEKKKTSTLSHEFKRDVYICQYAFFGSYRGRVRERMCKNRMRPLVYAVNIKAISKCTDVEFSVSFEVVWCVCVLIFFFFCCSRSLVHFTFLSEMRKGSHCRSRLSVSAYVCACAHSVVFIFCMHFSILMQTA